MDSGSHDIRPHSWGTTELPSESCLCCSRDEQPLHVFAFKQPEGLKVAAARRIGLRPTCLHLLRDGALIEVLDRTRGTDFEDFEDDALMPLLRAIAATVSG